MKPRYIRERQTVLARCPDCNADTSFEAKGTSGITGMGVSMALRRILHTNGVTYNRVLWQALACSVCCRGAIATLYDDGQFQSTILVDFMPTAIDDLVLPPSVPDDILAEYREAELDAAHKAYRSASAMLRSVLEKTLKKNGYTDVEFMDDAGNPVLDKQQKPRTSTKLIHLIDAAARDGVITQTRQKRAHENLRVLGNDILHDEWRVVTQEEFEEAHKYAQRILEDFYDDRPTVEVTLTVHGRQFEKPPVAAGPTV
jgi:hypothetical protein